MLYIPHVVFVDDEPNILHAIKRELQTRKIRWNFSFFDKPKEAIRYLDGPEHIDVIVTDIMMPDLNGMNSLQRH